MFYYLAELRDLFFGFNIFRYITFRASMAAVTTFLICLAFGPYFIERVRRLKIQEIAKRKDAPGLDKFQEIKEGTPTMGGLLIIGSIIISVLLWADLTNPYILITLLTCLWLTVLGFMDDYTKLTKTHQRGLSKRTKLLWQILLASIIGAFVHYNPDSSTVLTFPFLKETAINLGVFYIPLVAFILIGSSNAVNLTDGLDGLAIGCVLIVSLTLAILSYVAGNINFSEYLYLPFIKNAGELTIFCSAIVGASLGFLWFNCYPASIFMGDTGSLSLGGVLGVIAVLIKNELLLAVMGGVFVIEALSVILQVGFFKWKKTRLFKMAPFHHHLQLSGLMESKIIVRLWILAIIFAFLTLTTLKIR